LISTPQNSAEQRLPRLRLAKDSGPYSKNGLRDLCDLSDKGLIDDTSFQ